MRDFQAFAVILQQLEALAVAVGGMPETSRRNTVNQVVVKLRRRSRSRAIPAPADGTDPTKIET